jgi:hypothetical protein
VSKVLVVLGAVAAASLAGCGRTTYEVIDRPPHPFQVYGPLELFQVENLAGVADQEGTPFSTVLSEAIEERLTDEEFFARSGEPLKLRCRLIEYASEYSDPKLWGGGGSMIWGRVVLDVEFQGRDGKNAGRVKATGYSKKGGWAVASMNAAQRRAIQALVDFIEDFYDEP